MFIGFFWFFRALDYLVAKGRRLTGYEKKEGEPSTDFSDLETLMKEGVLATEARLDEIRDVIERGGSKEESSVGGARGRVRAFLRKVSSAGTSSSGSTSAAASPTCPVGSTRFGSALSSCSASRLWTSEISGTSTLAAAAGFEQ